MLFRAAGPSTGARIGPLDTFRCLTVTLALLSHALLEFRVDAVTSPDVWLALRSFTRSSTPGLLLLFGIMAEVVHFRRYREAPATLRPRLLRRAAQCYATFVALAALVTVCRPEPAAYLLRSFGFLTLEGYNVIFALYFFLLLLLLAVLPIRRRWGFGGLGVLLAAIWGLDLLVVSRLPPAADALKVLGDITLGTGGTWGPSVFHSLSLVIAGMAIGNALYARDRTPGGRALAAALGGVSVLLIAAEMARVGALDFFRGIVDLSKYRAHNDPVYYAYGVLGAAVTIPLAYALDSGAPGRLRRVLHALGGKTFSYFVIGNAVLILIPDYAVRSAGTAVGVIGIYLAGVAAVTLLWPRMASLLRRPALRHRQPTAPVGAAPER